MGRPRKNRLVSFEHNPRYFEPCGRSMDPTKEVSITIDELETLRLNYLEQLNQSEAAIRMQIHQSTFQRTLRKTLEKITDALVNGKTIRIKGGNYIMPGGDGTGPQGQGAMTGRGLRGGGRGQGGGGRGQGGGGRGAGFGGPEGGCRCPSCGYEQPHQLGVPCNQSKCPECGTFMVRT
ncbi:MAG: DUF134 domain-containing protein [Methanosarcinaceae archaeon]|nr:DUF134 domain-containing protein [Methanosarcinaceae archaeon]